MIDDGYVLAIERGAEERLSHGLVEALRSDEATGVLVLRGDRALVVDGRLVLVAPSRAPQGARWSFLGRRGDGSGLLLAALDPRGSAAEEDAWTSFRDAGAAIEADDAALFGVAISLGRWLHDAGFCPACGGELETAHSGWARRCEACATEHFPRTDPAVIVAVTSVDGERLLLGANAAWGGRMYSCFAGFVEAGESVERTITRELAEEGGIDAVDLRYVSSQAWPYPRSLMLGFHATAANEHEVRPDGDEIVDVRWFTRDEIRAGLEGRGEHMLPGPVSIAHRLIRAWCDARQAA